MNSTVPQPEPDSDKPVTSPLSDDAGPADDVGPVDIATHESVEAELVAASEARVVLPQPGLFFAMVLTSVPLFAQLIMGIGLTTVIAIVFVLVTARPHEVLRFVEDLQVFLLPVGTFVTLLVAVSVCWLFFGRNMGRKIAWRGISVGHLLCVLALTVPLAVLASEVTNCVGDLLRQFEADWLRALHETGGEVFQQFASMPSWLVFLGGCLLPGLGEEIYCRGLLSRGLVARYGVVGGTLLAAGLFGAMHLEPVQATGAFALGVGLQFVFLTTRSLAAPIVLHTLNNSFAFLTMRFAEACPIPGLTPLPDGSEAHTPIAVLATAVVAAAVLMAIMYQNRTRWQLPDGSDWRPGYVTAEMPNDVVGAVAVRAPVKPGLVLAAVVALSLFAVSLIAAHQSVVVNS